MEVYEILARAADVIDERGHCKNRVEDDAGHVCLIQALLIAAGDYTPELEKTCKVVDLFVGCNLLRFNNAPERTAAEVTSALRAASAIERAKHESAAPVNREEAVCT